MPSLSVTALEMIARPSATAAQVPATPEADPRARGVLGIAWVPEVDRQMTPQPATPFVW